MSVTLPMALVLGALGAVLALCALGVWFLRVPEDPQSSEPWTCRHCDREFVDGLGRNSQARHMRTYHRPYPLGPDDYH